MNADALLKGITAMLDIQDSLGMGGRSRKVSAFICVYLRIML
jgi:hypothetical protein